MKKLEKSYRYCSQVVISVEQTSTLSPNQLFIQVHLTSEIRHASNFRLELMAVLGGHCTFYNESVEDSIK